MAMEETAKTCGCPHHKVVPMSIVLLGAIFLLGALNVLTPGTVSIIWPVVVIAIGLTKLMAGNCKCC